MSYGHFETFKQNTLVYIDSVQLFYTKGHPHPEVDRNNPKSNIAIIKVTAFILRQLKKMFSFKLPVLRQGELRIL